ncbi:hypothetical protein [Mycolicibacterium celeriflavum]|uniref:hypothetical protein n=1 Tax=Mycolicibacterium celeriflavum TaxID=1249101 RepID=UPI003CF383C6
MTGLADGATLITAWEAATAVPEVARGAVVLARALGRPVEDILDLPLGECARLALIASIDVYGELAEVSCRCVHCGEVNEAPVDLRAFLTVPVADQMSLGSAAPITVHALTTRDLLAAAACDDPARSLRRRMVRGADVQLSEVELDTAAETMAGNAAIHLRMRCPCCGEDFVATLDPAELLWERVETSAPALLAQVATLAAVFGWTEHDVLAMGEQRRRAYLDLTGARQGAAR